MPSIKLNNIKPKALRLLKTLNSCNLVFKRGRKFDYIGTFRGGGREGINGFCSVMLILQREYSTANAPTLILF